MLVNLPTDTHVPGGYYQQTYQSSVRALVGEDAPPVYSRGKLFFNVDRWTWLILAQNMMKWAQENPDEEPTDNDISQWVWKANLVPQPKRHIVIAATPEPLDWETASALTGGSYHEALHTKHSCRRTLHPDEVVPHIRRLWDLCDWSKAGRTVMDSIQYVEDVRIENRGNDEYVGIYQAMCDLQDFILRMEEDGLAAARAHVKQADSKDGADKDGAETAEPWTELSTAFSTFRDLGLGYDTPRGRAALVRYQKTHPEVYEMVATGPLSPFVGRARDMAADDDLGSLWLSMEFVAQIAAVAADADSEYQETAEILLGQVEDGKGIGGLLDGNSALTIAIAAVWDEANEDLPPGEQPWRPYDPSLDEIHTVGEHLSAGDRATKAAEAEALLDEVYGEILFLRARLQQVIRTVAFSGIEHGAKRGSKLSERTLVDTFISLNMLHEEPETAFIEEDAEVNTSLAAAIVIDESSSMMGQRVTAAKVLMAITEPLDLLRYAVAVCGFRDKNAYADSPPDDWGDEFHRVQATYYDVFKRFGERFRDVLWRFACTRADDCTPMSDGIQYGLNQLRSRREAHRVLFVVTDGWPTGQHARVVRWQIRMARREGIFVVGVGIGSGSRGVVQLFHDSVWAPEISNLPQALLVKLNELLDFRKVSQLSA